jgi:hypothetical protein
MHRVKARLFKVIRHQDKKNISGVGKVIEGAVFPDGKVVIQWQNETSSISIFRNLEDFQNTHVKPIFNENEFIWREGYEPSDEVNEVLDQVIEFVMSYSGGRISDKTKGEIVSKAMAIKKTNERQQRGGVPPSYERNIKKNARPPVRLATLKGNSKGAEND